MRAVPAIAVVALGLSGCILDRSGTATADGESGVDAAAMDAGPAGTDGGWDAGRDAGRDPIPDAGCSGEDPVCAGERVVRCVDGTSLEEDCASAGAFCESGACMPWVCPPGTATCDGIRESRCDARGAALTASTCATRSCAPAGWI